MRNVVTRSLTAAASLCCAGLSAANAADIPTPQTEMQPPPAYSGPPPVQPRYAYPQPAPYGYPPPPSPVAYYYPPPPVVVPAPYYVRSAYWHAPYWRAPYWRGAYLPRPYFAQGYGHWARYRRW
jgi:hypothetical protein